MMSIAATVVKAASVVSACGVIGGGALYLDTTHVQATEFSAHISESRVRTIFGYLDQIDKNGPQPWLCRALHQEFVQLCTEVPHHSLCQDRQAIMQSTGCNH